MLYGHLHNTIEEQLFQKYLSEFNQDKQPDYQMNETECVAYNVGMCLWNYEPVSAGEILCASEQKKEIRK